MSIAPFEPATATAAELDDYFQVELASSAADRPSGPRPTAESVIASLTQPVSPHRRERHWTARDGNRIVGTAFLHLPDDQNTDLASTEVTVHPEYRRRGLGTALLRELAAAAEGREIVMIEGLAEGGAGQAWADARGFAVVQRTLRQTLDLRAVDRFRWQATAAAGYRLARWLGSVPDELLASYAAARNAIQDAPLGDMAFTMPEYTPVRVREEEARARAKHCQLRVVAVIREQTEEVAGLTYLEVYQSRPELAVQQDTAVLPAHRGHRLGLWMKAQNLRWLVAEHPGIQRVRTSAAADNEHMLRVNRQLGFVVDLATQIRQAPLADLAARLGLT